ncbi:Hypothetical predicted protein [Paramuricea clavata]|uniref:Uncharacterized protein n=1 Tax=Paramuricea clavata TaxID=317549 RepID=A0A7D9DCC1_PARCT|nr:Hypothetical predicted protein [Paramuricea clavata]
MAETAKDDIATSTTNTMGKLLKKAKETVISQGYEFVKGKSRARSLSDMDSGKESKRKKTDKDERAKEIQNTSDILKNIQEQIEIKQLRLQKQKSLNNFSKCDQIVGEIGKLMNEKKILEKQLKHMEKKEAKSKWYYNKKGSEKRKSGESKQKGKRKSFDIAKMFKNASDISEHTLTSTSDSNESFDTLIVSSDETEGGIEAAADIPQEAEDHSPDLFSQQEETGNQSPDMFSQQEETGNQSPDMFSQQGETRNQSPHMLSQQEETGNQSPDMLSQQVKSNECNDIQKQMGTSDGDFA